MVMKKRNTESINYQLQSIENRKTNEMFDEIYEL